MDLSNKNILVAGLGKSGQQLIAFLDGKAKKVYAFDAKKENEQNYNTQDFGNTEFRFGENPSGDEEIDIVIMSPGISLEKDFVKSFQKRDIEVIGEIELAYRLSKGKYVGITGTNGKTTTTALTGQIFKNAGFDTKIVGNIGNPLISEIEHATEETVFVTELSSFQLETAKELRCHAATIINITPDHLDRHHTMENYANCKLKVFQNQNEEDYAVVNIDDKISFESTKNLKSKTIYISVNEDLKSKGFESFIHLQEGRICGKILGESFDLMSLSELKLRGKHNYENVLCAIGLSLAFQIPKDAIKETLQSFMGVEHRLEYVENIKGVTYINDSKGTNPDASIKALEAIGSGIILIAGGYDKGSDFNEFAKHFKNRVRFAILLGETAQKLKSALEANGFADCVLVGDMKEAVAYANQIAAEGDTVLLSPACASWDMYKSFEQRGEHFKTLVKELISI